jgi:hypothetical protein
MMTPDISSSRPLTMNDRQTWLSLISGAIIWFLHLNIVYPLTSLACKWEWFPFNDAGMTGLRTLQIVITLIAAVLIGIVIYLPWRHWQRFQTDRDHMLRETESDRRPFIAFVALGLNLFFLAFVVAAIVPILALSPCN